jgi:hypothetical protein
MARPVSDTPEETPPDPWADAPIAVGRHRRRLGIALIALTIAGIAAFILFDSRGMSPLSPGPGRPQTTLSVPFDVVVDVADVASMDNDVLFGRETASPPRDAVDRATRQVGEVVRRYLDAEFVTAETRFSDRPLAGLLSRRALDALTDDALAGLGVLEVAVEQVEAEPVTASARVLTSGSDVAVMTVRYEARATVMSTDGDTAPLHQSATIVFALEDGGWRAEAVDAVLDLQLAAGEGGL